VQYRRPREVENVGSGFPILLPWKQKKMAASWCVSQCRQMFVGSAVKTSILIQFMRGVEAGRIIET
jgi:hypothetical protein